MKEETLPTCCAELWDPLGEEDGSRSIVIGIGSFFAASINWRHLNDSRRKLQEEVDGHMDLFDAHRYLRHCACLRVLTQNRDRSQTLPSLLTRPILRRYAHQTTKNTPHTLPPAALHLLLVVFSLPDFLASVSPAFQRQKMHQKGPECVLLPEHNAI